MLVAAFVTCLCLVGATAPVASADSSAKIMERCAQGKSLTGFTVKQYQSALEHLTTEEIEYHSECVEEIQQAELAAASHKRAGGSGGSSVGSGPGGGSLGGGSPNGGQPVEPTPSQEQILEAARKGRSHAVRLGGDARGPLSPGVVHPDLAAAASDLPPAVLAVVVAVIGGILLLACHDIRERVQRPRHS